MLLQSSHIKDEGDTLLSSLIKQYALRSKDSRVDHIQHCTMSSTLITNSLCTRYVNQKMSFFRYLPHCYRHLLQRHTAYTSNQFTVNSLTVYHFTQINTQWGPQFVVPVIPGSSQPAQQPSYSSAVSTSTNLQQTQSQCMQMKKKSFIRN